MWNRISCLFIGAVLLTLMFEPLAPAQVQTNDSNLLVRAQEEFSQGFFTKSLGTYRDYLRSHPKDQDAWTRFAANYYHTGQAQQALEYLNKSRPSPSLRSFHLFYRALCYDALGESERSKKMLARLGKSDDPLAEAALFEKASIEFAQGDAGAAKVTVEEHKRRFRDGRYKAQIDFIQENLSQAGKVAVPESQRTLYTKNFYAIHPLSLMNIPHSWVYQFGFEYATGERNAPRVNPTEPPVIKIYDESRLLAKAGLNLGPFVTNTTKTTVGYIYAQNWESDAERTNYSRENPFDLEYFPYRPDLMERSHRIIVESVARSSWMGAGFYAHLDFRRGGSSLFPAPERPEIKTSFSIGTNSFFAPYAEAYFADTHKVKLAAYFEKFIDNEDNDFSFKTFNISNNFDDPFVSFSLAQESLWKSLSLSTNLEFFRWIYLYNDFWEGYTSTGGAASVQIATPDFTYFPSLVLGSRFVMSQREYASEQIKTGACADNRPPVPYEDSPVPSTTVSTCKREESLMNARASISYVGKLRQHALSFVFDYELRENEVQTVFNANKMNFLFIFTQAFPNLEQGARLLEPPRGLRDQRVPY